MNVEQTQAEGPQGSDGGPGVGPHAGGGDTPVLQAPGKAVNEGGKVGGKPHTKKAEILVSQAFPLPP